MTPDTIRQARLDAGLTMAAAAALVHVHPNTWNKWERGDRAIHPAFWELFQLKLKRSKR